MIISPGPTIAGHRTTKSFGLARGNSIRARHIGKDILAVFKNMAGGEIEEYTKLMGEAREQAIDRMVAQAQSYGANAVVNVRFTTSLIMGGCSEILAYGDAVIIESESPQN